MGLSTCGGVLSSLGSSSLGTKIVTLAAFCGSEGRGLWWLSKSVTLTPIDGGGFLTVQHCAPIEKLIITKL